MKRSKFASQEQPLPLLFRPLLNQQQQVKTFDLVPHSGDTGAVTVAVASDIKPQATPGQAVVDMLTNKPVSGTDYRVIVQLGSIVGEPRLIMLPASVADSAALVGETLVGTIVRDDNTKPTSSHSLTLESAFLDGDTPLSLGIPLDNVVKPQKPKRNVASLINAILDAFKAEYDAEAITDYVLSITFDQTSDGSLKVYYGGTPTGTLTGKVADVDLTTPVDPSTPDIW